MFIEHRMVKEQGGRSVSKSKASPGRKHPDGAQNRRLPGSRQHREQLETDRDRQDRMNVWPAGRQLREAREYREDSRDRALRDRRQP